MADAGPQELFAESMSPVWIVTVQSDGERAGLVCTTVMPASIVESMPRVIVTLAKQHYTAGLVRRRKAFALNLLASSQVDLGLRFGILSGNDTDKWEDLEMEESPSGHPLFSGSAGWVDCNVEACFDSGDRWILLAECRDCSRLDHVQAMVVSDLIGAADETQRAELKRLRRRDADRDAAAIRVWRSSSSL